MKINGEEVELVTDFATLRTGMRVLETPCRYCGGVHRHWLGNPGSGETVDAGGKDLGITRYFGILSTDDCHRHLEIVLSERMVAKRVVYRIVDPTVRIAAALDPPPDDPWTAGERAVGVMFAVLGIYVVSAVLALVFG